MHIAELWRYPIKSLGGERLQTVDVTLDGVAGDRLVHVQGAGGPLTGRVRHGLLTIPVTTGADGEPLVAGHPWKSAEALDILRSHAGDGARLAAFAGPERFDILNLLVATDGAVAHFGEDVRRLRPNIVVGGVVGDAERDWPGQAIEIGEVLVGVHSLRQRCVVTSIDPDTGERNPDVWKWIRTEFDNRLALNSWVIRPGTINVGDEARLIPTAAEPLDIGGWAVGAPYRVSR